MPILVWVLPVPAEVEGIPGTYVSNVSHSHTSRLCSNTDKPTFDHHGSVPQLLQLPLSYSDPGHRMQM